MSDLHSTPIPAETVEFDLREGLARGDAVLGSVPGVLRHLLAHDDDALFAEDVLARLRGMLRDLAGQLAAALTDGVLRVAPAPADPVLMARIEKVLIATPGLLAHLHVTAIEWQVTTSLQARLGLDPVLSPLVQALVASPDGETGAAAMKMLAAQARFVQFQRQMRLPLTELPPDLLHAVLAGLAALDQDGKGAGAVRAQYDESATRQGLLARLVISMGAGAIAALSLGHGGLALFTTTLAIASALPRDVCVLATQAGQLPRLALALRAAGLRPSVIEQDLLALHAGAAGPCGIAALSPERAVALLAASPLMTGAFDGRPGSAGRGW